jgi:hypothetical protein
MANPRIKELPEIAVIDGSMIIPVYDYATDTTFFVTLDNLIPTAPSNDYRWDSATTYGAGELTTYLGKIWESQSPGNLNNVPFTGSTFWVEQSPSLSGVRWTAGVFTTTDSTVISNITGRNSVYILTVAAPFVSSDFAAELAAGTWKELSEDELYAYSVAGATIVLDCKGARVMRFKTQAIAGTKAWQLLNADNLIEGTIFFELTGGGPWDQDFSDVSIAPISDNGLWDLGTKIWSPIQAGKYKLKIEHNGTEFYLSISNAGA